MAVFERGKQSIVIGNTDTKIPIFLIGGPQRIYSHHLFKDYSVSNFHGDVAHDHHVFLFLKTIPNCRMPDVSDWYPYCMYVLRNFYQIFRLTDFTFDLVISSTIQHRTNYLDKNVERRKFIDRVYRMTSVTRLCINCGAIFEVSLITLRIWQDRQESLILENFKRSLTFPLFWVWCFCYCFCICMTFVMLHFVILLNTIWILQFEIIA